MQGLRPEMQGASLEARGTGKEPNLCVHRAAARWTEPGGGRWSESGFTLLEILVALTVTAIVLTMIYGIAGRMSSAKKKLEQEAVGYQEARVLFDRMSREIRSLYFPKGAKDAVFRGGKDDKGNFYLELTTTVISPTLPRSSGIAQVRYDLQDDPDHPSGLPVLVRHEQVLLPGGDGKGMEYRLSSGVSAFRVRFFDGSNWQEQWDATSQGGLPQIVEIYLEIEIGGKRLPFMTAVEVPQSGVP